MNTLHNSELTPNARRLRKNMTKEERKLWYEFLKPCPYTIKRQKIIGRYLVDFYCAEAKIIIELDGSQHFEEAEREKDKRRDADLRTLGYRVLRYSNSEVNRNFTGVCEDILRHLEENKPSP